MAFKKNFRVLEDRINYEYVKQYYTSHGNQCERRHGAGKIAVGRRNSFAIISARSIATFLQEINDGSELSSSTSLHYQTDESKISCAIILGGQVITVTSFSKADAESFVSNNRGMISDIKLESTKDIESNGIKWLLKDPTIVKVTWSRAGISEPTLKILSFGLFLQEIRLSGIYVENTFKISNTFHLNCLTTLIVHYVAAQSKKEEILFFRTVELLPTLNHLEYHHAYKGNTFDRIKYSCTLTSRYECCSLGRLLNLWKPMNEVKYDVDLVVQFDEVYCKSVLSRLFSSMKNLDSLVLSKTFFGEDEALISKPHMFKDIMTATTEDIPILLNRAQLLPPTVPPQAIDEDEDDEDIYLTKDGYGRRSSISLVDDEYKLEETQ